MVDQDINPIAAREEDPLWHQLKSVPAFRALLRAVEARFYRVLDLPQPLLDFGCGDGHFTQAAFNQAVAAGVDLDLDSLLNSSRRRAYELPLQAAGVDLPFVDRCFASAISNSTLEHIPDIQPVLAEINRVLKPDAPFVITVPSHNFTNYLGGARFLNRLGLGRLSEQYKALFNRISRHTRTDSPEVWAGRLAQAGFTVERWQYYFSQDAMHAFEWGHLGGIPSAIIHALTGHWILGPWKSNLKWTEQWARPYYEEEFPDEGAYILFLARKKSESPIAATLPQANPFTRQELTMVIERETEDAAPAIPPPIGEAQQELLPAIDEEVAENERVGPLINWQPFISGALVIFALLFATWGQTQIQANPTEPGTGAGWFGLSALMLLLLVWQQRSIHFSWPAFSIPSLSDTLPRRWLYFSALLLALIAPRFVTGNVQQRPAVAILIWLAAVGIAYYSLTVDSPVSSAERNPDPKTKRVDVAITLGLFLVALLVRLYQLGSHPFILNGSEASIGLDVLSVIRENSRNPFSTAWLTNPTLPLYLMAVPIKLLGPSAFSVRLTSTFVGAIAVGAIFLIGRRLYGFAIGLVAAILLLGSHFHVHYSRLGLTNSWDALLVLLSLGLIAIAWESNSRNKRRVWLAAGIATGLNAYLYTSSHLLPVMLGLLAITTLLFERDNWRSQWRHVLAMCALALVIALPQMRHYQANPGLFMERANIVGILDNQSGWLSREATQNGVSQAELLAGQLWRAGLAFNATLDRGTYYGPSLPLLNFAAGILAVLGFILALFRYKHVRFSMLVVWIGTTIVLGGALLENPPNSHRLIIAAPAVMFLAALALVELITTLLGAARKNGGEIEGSFAKSQGRIIFLLIPLIIALFITFYDIVYYFGPYRTEHHFADRNTEVANDMAQYLNSLEGDWSAYFFGPPSMYVGFSSIPFLVHDFQESQNLFDIIEFGAPLPVDKSLNLTFIFLPERYNELEQVLAAYPGGEERVFSGYYADPLFYVYEVRQ
ncbi:MAG: glycosyltransferase family 39 protein [Candidatus Promineifilaceae bacterium]|nr:glycosyltransferase family 39 protein [Candidatus Promineifilaceae bacterium]